VSSLDYYPSSTDARRQIRIYSREASSGFIPKLSATSENLPGLEGAVNWRPSGNLISGLVRYGYEGGAPGKEGRWEVAMLERNGLRHGGFELREDMANWKDAKVKGLRWNSDSEILAIWISRAEEDVGESTAKKKRALSNAPVQLWSMKNYHYYLKQELFSTTSGRFSNVMWHPEQPMTLYLVEHGELTQVTRADHLACIQVRQFVWDTYAAHLPMPSDTASVAVVDGSHLLITPFRTQNTPPPMASYTIGLPTTPIHVAMSNTTDSLSVLYRNGLVQVWDLNTRVPDRKGSKLRGGGKVAEPKLAWEQTAQLDGLVGMSLAIGQEGQIAILASGAEGTKLITMANGQEDNVQQAEADVERVLFSSDERLLSINKAGGFRLGQYLSVDDVLC
jgi:elongator complex protein 1